MINGRPSMRLLHMYELTGLSLDDYGIVIVSRYRAAATDLNSMRASVWTPRILWLGYGEKHCHHRTGIWWPNTNGSPPDALLVKEWLDRSGGGFVEIDSPEHAAMIMNENVDVVSWSIQRYDPASDSYLRIG